MNQIPHQVFVERYKRTFSYLPQATANHTLVGGGFSIALATLSSLGWMSIVWYLILLVCIASRYFHQKWLLSRIDQFAERHNFFDLLFALTPTINGLCWGVVGYLVLQLNQIDITLASIIVISAVAFYGFPFLTLSRASYIGYYVAVFLPILIHFAIAPEGKLVSIVIFIGLLHFVFFNRFLYKQSTSRIQDYFQLESLLNRVTETEQALKRHSELDMLTELPNRSHYQKQFRAMHFKAILKESPIAVVLMDIDHFKSVNDTHGHLTGDIALQQVAKVLKQFANKNVILGRFGGEEFIGIIYNPSSETIDETLNTVRQAVEAQPIESESKEKLHLTISLGAVITKPSVKSTIKDYIKVADQALYESKRQGRNRVTIFNRL
ncbi:GGDEF domain-containing protein [Vibrio sp. SCSIO 43136]|uniref:GGDEF domain-containing protein n=1 Tax=Vibrio sp. SCSIO 43136 TaxID=2819101 RepID=UPI0020753FCA|nr:GGDEF domain-containing protein [Vibrio sp. SCSIO 43136]USD68183.1 GGDEF domain-containing protein [Vibrio sp. SCSIO 43136]